MKHFKKIDGKNIADIVALTPTQEGMLFYYLRDPRSSHYFEQLSLLLTGEIDFNCFRRAWGSVVETNEMLRAQFRWERVKNPVMVVLETHSPQIIYHDLSKGNLSEKEKKNSLNEIKVKDREAGFNLNSVPFRITLCKLEKDRYEMIVSNHHILYDGWSNRIVLEDFFLSYLNLVRHKFPQKPARPRYKEYINFLLKRDKAAQENFWKAYLKEFRGKPEFSFKQENDTSPSFPGAAVSFYNVDFSKPLKERLETFTTTLKITLSTLIYSAWGLLLQRYCNSEDVVFGTTVSGRATGIKGIEDIVGLFINTVPLRVRTTAAGDCRVTAKDFLARLNDGLRERESFETTSLVEIKKYAGLRFEEEFFNTIVVIENYPLDKLLSGKKHIFPQPLTVDSYSIVETTHYDLSVGVIPGDEIRVQFSFNADRLDEAVIKEMAGHFKHIVEDIIDNPGKELAALEVLTDREKDEIIYRFNNTKKEVPEDKTIHGLFADQVEQTPDRVSVIGAGTREGAIRKWNVHQITYRELNRKSDHLARLLTEKGAGADTIVGILMNRSLEMIIGIMGILKSGAAYLPIDPDYPLERIRFMLQDSGIGLLVSTGTLAEKVKNEPGIGVIDMLEYTASSSPQLPGLSMSSPSSLAYVIYTSGSTGKPKGVLVEHGSTVNMVTSLKRRLKIDLSDRVLLFSNICFDVSVEQIFLSLTSGAALLVIDRPTLMDNDRFERYLLDNSVTHLNAVPLFLANLDLNFPGSHGLRRIIAGGDVCPLSLARRMSRYGTFYNAYGPTETTVTTTSKKIEYPVENMPRVPVGKPIDNAKCYILDKWHKLVPVGLSGELYISGKGVVRGYLNRPELTAEKFVISHLSSIISDLTNDQCPMTNDRLYRTGDLARWLPNGDIEYLGRIDLQVKIRGFRVELGEIESRLLNSGNIKDAAVIVSEGNDGEKYLCAYITSEETIDITELTAELSSALPDYIVPAYIRQLDSIPLTVSGKIDRRALQDLEPGTGPAGIEIACTAPENPVEEALVSIWSEVLNIERKEIGTGYDFFKLGGHSLKAVRLISGIRKTLNVEVPLDKIFELTTIKKLAGYISSLTEVTYEPIDPAEEKEYYTLSSGQRRLYVLQEMVATSVAYNMPSLWSVEGNLDKNRLEHAFNELAEQHESLRTSFHMIGDVPVQRVEKKICTFQIANKTDNFVRPFDLTQAPLLRVGLSQVGAEKSILAVDMHHIIADGTSMGILIRDFIALYEGKERPGTVPRTRYRDYCEWRSKGQVQEVFRQQESFWLNRFEGDIPLLELPLDYIRPGIQNFEGSALEFDINGEETRVLNELAAGGGATLFMVLLAVFNIFLSRISSQEEIVVGTTTAGRGHEDLQQVIGMFVNTLALKNEPHGEKTPRKFLKEVKESTLAAFANQDYPYEELVEKVNVNRDTGRNPLFDTMLVLQNLEMQEIEIPGLKLTPIPFEQDIAKFDLMLVCEEKKDRISCLFEYRTKLFRRETIEKFSGFFKRLISSIQARPDEKISGLEIISEEEKNWILYDFNRTEEEFPRHKTVHLLFEEQVKKTPDHITVEFDNHLVTYGQLNENADRLAYYLVEQGVRPDSIVATMMQPSIELVIGIYAILKAGAAYLPIDPDIPGGRIDYILKDSGAALCLDNESYKTYKSYRSHRSHKINAAPSNLAYVIYTSGSTGRPKGVAVEHRQLVNFVYHMYNRYDRGIGGNDRCLGHTNMMFDVSVWEFFLPLLFGARLVLLPGQAHFDIFTLVRVVLERGITLIYIPPGLLNPVKELLTEHRGQLRLNKMLVGVEPIRDKTLEDYIRLNPHMRIINGYGPTETTICATSLNYISHTPQGEIVPIGKPLANNRVVLLDAADHVVPLGIAGEICISGEGVSRGYLNNPYLTAEKYVAHPYFKDKRMYRTGDMARWLPGGDILFIGRRDQQVKIRGYRIELGEIENRLLKHKDIKQAIVLAKADEKAGKYLCAYIVADVILDTSELQEYLAGDLPGYMIPQYFIQQEQIPLTANGKVNRRALPEPEILPETGKYVAPTNEMEHKLVQVWAEILNLREEDIGIHADFFVLGGHSLKATSLVSKIYQTFHVNVPLSEIFIHPTIRELGLFIEQSAVDEHISIEPLEKKEYYPLSSAQRRLYVLQQMDETVVGYNIPAMCRVTGDLDAGKVESAFRRLIERHESLRTSVHIVDDKPVQRVHDRVPFSIEWRTESKDFLRPFDLRKAPLLKAALIKAGEQDHFLLLDMHHLISDGASVQVLIKDFIVLYSGGNLPLPRLQYKDFSEWQNSPPQMEVIKLQEIFWLDRFKGEVPALNLPTDFPRPLIRGFAGQSMVFRIEGQAYQGLKTLSRIEGVTLYMALLSIFTVFLAKLSGQEDIVVGTPVAGRRHADLENIIGMFVNTLAMRNYPGPQIPFTKFLKDVKERTLESFENQDYQYEKLVNKVTVDRDTGRNPLFDTLLVLQNMDIPEIEIPGLNITPFFHDWNTAKFDLTLMCVETDEHLSCTFEFSTKLFKRETIERFAAYLQNIIPQVSANPAAIVSEIEIITEEEKAQVLNNLVDKEVKYPSGKTIHDLFMEQAVRYPDRIAAAGESFSNHMQMTYRELNEASDQLACLLLEKGVGTGSIVAIRLERSLEMIVALFAVLKAGGAYLPIDTGYPEERVDYMLKDSAARVLIGEEGKEDYCLLSIVDYRLSMRRLKKTTRSPAGAHRTRANHLAYIIYTSGTTGKPKGAAIEHENVVRLMINNKFPFDFSPYDIWTMFHSFCFDFSVWEIYGALLYGGKVIVVPGMTARDTGAFLKLLEKERVTVLNQTPSAFYHLIQRSLDPPANDSKLPGLALRYVIFGGEALKPDRLKEWKAAYPAVRLINMYGITETTVHVTFQEIGEADIASGKSNIGKPIPTLYTLVTDRNMKLQPAGVPGELCVGGKGVGRGYLNRPELTAEKFVQNPFKPEDILYKSGDLVRLWCNGDLEYLGRIDLQVKIRGYRVELEEIENRLLKHENIKEAVVLAREDKTGDRYLCAYVVVDSLYPGEDSLKNHLAAVLPDYMIPAYFVVLESIPLNTSGKVNRTALPDPEFKASEKYTAPRDSLEEQLAELWASVLGRKKETIGIDDNFFRLGGHSLKAALLAAKIRKDLNVNIPLADFFVIPFIRGLAGTIRKSSTEKYISLEPVEEKEYYAASSAQKRIYVLQQMGEQGIGIAYNVTAAFILAGQIEKGRLEHTFRHLIHRHDGLRTSFDVVEGEPVQRIHSHVSFSIEQGAGSTASRAAVVNRFIRPFDLSRAPLLRVGLFETGEQQYLLIVDMHHIITDGTSVNRFAKEFMAVYGGEELPPLRNSYKDYALWQNSKGQLQELEQQEEYWQKQFAGDIPVLDLPVDCARPAVRGFEGSMLKFEINSSDTAALKELALGEGVTQFMVVLCVYTIFLSKLSNQEDIVVGIPIANRGHADLEPVMGMFVNTLALRNYPAGEKSVKGFLAEIKNNTLNAFANRDFPYEELVEKVTVDRNADRNPLFDAMFILQNLDVPAIEIPGLKMTPISYERTISKFDLTLECREPGENLSCLLEYSTKLFKQDTIERFSRYLTNIISAVTADREQKLSAVDMLPVEEKKQLILDFNDTAEEFPGDKTIYRLIEEQAGCIPDHIAMVGLRLQDINNKHHLTYRELNEQSGRLANYLHLEKGIGPGQPVAVLMERSLELIISLIGVMKSGGAYVPLDPSLPPDRLRMMCNDASIGVVISQQKFNRKLSHLQTQCSGSLSLLYMDGPQNGIIERPAIRPDCRGADFPAYVMYTSGSSGTPKGVLVEHRTIVNTLMWRKNYYDYQPGDVSLRNPPYFFDSSVTDIFTPLLGGARLVLVPEDKRTDLQVLKQVITTENVSHFIAVPAFYNVMLEEIPEALMHVKRICVAGEHFPDELIRRHFKTLLEVRIFNEYGPTENSVNTTAYELQPDSQKALIGKPISNVQVYILDRSLNLSPVGVTGEICIAGSSLARGYLNNPELTAERFVVSHLSSVISDLTNDQCPMSNDRFYHTGDMGRWLPDGNLEFVGRLDNQVKIRGIRVETGEIENHLMQCEEVKEVVVLARNRSGRSSSEKYLCAYIVPANSEDEEDKKDFRAYLSGKLPEYMIPSYFVPVKNIPFTSGGKIDRKALPIPDLEEENDIVAPRDEIEKKLLRIWSGVLGLAEDKIGINSDFFQLGGHSLKATQLSSRIHKELDVTVPLTEIFVTPFISRIAGFIKKQAQLPFSSIPAVESKEYYPVTSPQRRLYILKQLDEHGIGYNLPSLFILAGHVDKSKFEHTFLKLIERHESLRTSFLMIDGEPVQRVHPIDDMEFQLEVKPSALTPRPFDLSQAPLLRVGLTGSYDQNYRLLIDMHHIISDGVSTNVLINDFMMLYQGMEPAPLRIQYKDVAEWQNHKKQQQAIDRQRLYWEEQFKEDIPALNLPADYVRPMVLSFEGASVLFEVGEEETRLLKSTAQEQGVTLFMLLLSMYTIFLSRLCGQEDIIVGTPIAGRRHADLEPIIGMFVNMLVLRNFPNDNKPLSQFIEETKKTALKAFENQDYPFEDLVERAETSRDTSRNPLFDTMFLLQNVETTSLEIPGMTLKPCNVETNIAKFDLSLVAMETGDTLTCKLEYRTKLFKEQTIKRFITYFKAIVSSILSTIKEDRGARIGQLEITPLNEKQQILYTFNDTEADYPRDKTIHRLFSEQVQRTPDLTAVTYPGKNVYREGNHSITYKELHEKSDRLSYLLKQKGILPASIVAIKIAPSIELVTGLLGILKAGCAYLPIDPRTPQERIDYMQADSGTGFTVTAAVLAEADDDDRVPPPPALAPSLPSNSPAYVIYTSGSTGRPKGVVLEHRTVVNFIKGITDIIEFSEKDTILSLTTISFDIFVLESFLPLSRGSRVVVGSEEQRADPGAAAKVLADEKVTIFQTTPSRLSMLTAMTQAAAALKPLKYLLIGGEELPPQLLEKARASTTGKIYNMYGPTETTVWSTVKNVSAGEALNIGKPIINTTIFILDKNRSPVPIGIAGELFIGGDGLARGYLNRPELTAEKFILARSSWLIAGRKNKKKKLSNINAVKSESPIAGFINPTSYELRATNCLYRTGDLARWLPDGNIEFLGRVDFQVKIRGFRVELGEIEARLKTHPAVEEAIVINRKDRGRQYLCAYLTTGPGQGVLSVHELKEYLDGKLPGYMIPACFVKVESIPLNVSGKVDRGKLPRPLESDFHTGGSYEAPKSSLQKTIAQTWQEVLGREKVGITDNFFDLGGNSLDFVKISNILKEKLDKEIPVINLLTYPTIRSLELFLNRDREDTLSGHNPEDHTQLIDEGKELMLQTLNLLDDGD
jgi:tyrocidine synthetase-3